YYTSYIGGYKSVNAFPYEVRIPPAPVKYNFNQPYAGYTLKPRYTVTIVRSYANEDCLPFNEYQFVKTLAPTDSSPFIIPLDTNDGTFNSVTGCTSATGAFPNAV